MLEGLAVSGILNRLLYRNKPSACVTRFRVAVKTIDRGDVREGSGSREYSQGDFENNLQGQSRCKVIQGEMAFANHFNELLSESQDGINNKWNVV
jgi:hypothetical protein